MRVEDSGFRVQGSGFRVQGSGFRVQGFGFRVCLCEYGNGAEEEVEQPKHHRTHPAHTPDHKGGF